MTGLTTAQMKSGVAFAGWDTDVWKFAEGQYPRLRAFIPKYTVTWLGEDGVTVLKEEIVDEGDTPTCEAPTKEDGELNTYTFSGWEPEVTPVESNTTYTATFLAQPKWTGTGTAGDPYVLTTPARIKEIIALYGASVPDEIYVSTGNGVTSESLTAQLPAGYAVRATGTANVVKIVKIVSVVWKNYDGTVLERDDDVAIGTEPSYDGATPTKASTEQYSYTFAGWTPTVVTVAGSAEYTATYTETLRSYTITWLDADGTSLGTTTVAYGATPSHSAPASAYTFTGWSPAIAAVTGDETYTATFSHEVVLTNLTGDYTAADGDVLTGSTTYNVSIPGGATVTLNGVSVIGAGGGGSVAPAPQFDASGESVTTKFVQGANGKWTLTTFAELANDAIGAEVLPEVIKVYAAETLPGLDSATPMTTGVEIKERASAVKTTIEVTPPSGTRSQFFKVTFDE